MTLTDLDQVMAIERVAFSAPWSSRAYEYEITQNEYSTMLVVRVERRSGGRLARLLHHFGLTQRAPVLGYAGFWFLVDEIHVSTIAVDPQCRGWGLGELLLIALLDRGAELGARRATLEVRASNLAAQGLYHKYGFETVGVQERYYADNNEDAYIMVSPAFEMPEFQANLRQCRARLWARLRTEGADTQDLVGSRHDSVLSGRTG
jgi:ribosomal-protein-alanine N-acetyltransferase